MAETTAPTEKSNVGVRRMSIFIYTLFTTAGGLFLEYLLDHWRNWHTLSDYYLFLFVPIGAIAMSALCASGGLIYAWKQRMKIRGWLPIAISLVLFAAFFVSKYIDFRRSPPPPIQIGVREVPTEFYQTTRKVPILQTFGFWEYFDFQATHRRYAATEKGQKTEPLGAVGYLWVITAVAGFSLAWFFVPYLYQHGPYCRKCERFMTERPIALFPAGLPYRLFAKSDDMSHEEYEKQHNIELQKAVQRARNLEAKAKALDMDGFLADLNESSPENPEVRKLPRKLETILTQCPDCSSGFLELNLVHSQDEEDEDDIKKEKVDTLFLKTAFLKQLKTRIDNG